MFKTNISLNSKNYCNRHQPIYNWYGCEQFMFTFTWRREEPNFYIPRHPCVRSVKLMNWCHDAPATICQRYELARDSVHALSSDKASGDIFERLFTLQLSEGDKNQTSTSTDSFYFICLLQRWFECRCWNHSTLLSTMPQLQSDNSIARKLWTQSR